MQGRFSKIYAICILLLVASPIIREENSVEKFINISRKFSKSTVYLGVGLAFSAASILGRLGWGFCSISPWNSTLKEEYRRFSDLCGSAAHRSFSHMTRDSSINSEMSWQQNQKTLSQIPALSKKELKLLQFLKNRWLSKVTGFFPIVVDWICPCYNIEVQVNPETTSCYARTPFTKFSQTYIQRKEMWKKILPHPDNFPLILTRPFPLRDYLPAYLAVDLSEKLERVVKRIAALQNGETKTVVDITEIFPSDQNRWVSFWEKYREKFSKKCHEQGVNPLQTICIQRVYHEEIGGIRILPWADLSEKEIESDYTHLLRWVSVFGLTANRIELDRWESAEDVENALKTSPEFLSKDEFTRYLKSFELTWNTHNPQKRLMILGTLNVLKGILDSEKWKELDSTSTLLTSITLLKIQEELKLLEKDRFSFFETMSHIEQIHAHLSTILEVVSPYTSNDFSKIYLDCLSCIPSELKSFAKAGIHTSAMTSMAGIFKAVEKIAGCRPHVLYGENTYFECITAVNLASNAVEIEKAQEEDWKKVDLIVAQFNPVLKRIDLKFDGYKVENVAETLKKALHAKNGKPVTLALDCTLDYIDSPRVGKLLNEFQEEIKTGKLAVIGYRSGHKFDLFGMDNYCGAPFFTLHNRDPNWSSFDLLSIDPVLQTDRLSLHWFCLAYGHAAHNLELYRKKIFENTRSLLDKVPTRLFQSDVDYRIMPVAQEADAAFIDIKIRGPSHQIRGSALVGGTLYLDCMEGSEPVFFRPSLGFYHLNFTMIFDEACTTIRLTLGLDPAQIDLLVKCFEKIDKLNEKPMETIEPIVSFLAYAP